MARAYVALGSNLDEPEAQVRNALATLNELPETQVVRSSRLYRTPPWGMLDQPWFVNAAVALDTELTPQGLMRALQSLELRSGRKRGSPRWGPRRIDLDLLLYDDLVIDTPELQLPHPRLAERAFVLVPLADVAKDLTLPGGQSVEALLAQVDTAGIEPLI